MVSVAVGFFARSRLASIPSPESDVTPGWSYFQGFLHPYRWPLSIGLFLLLVSTALSLLTPWPLKLLIDNVIGGDPMPSQLSVLDGFDRYEQAMITAGSSVVLVLAAVMVDYLVTYLVGAVEQRVTADMRAAVFRRLHTRSLQFHDRNQTGDLVARLTEDVSRVRDMMVAWFDRVLPEVLTLLGILIIALLIDPWLTMAAVSVVPLLLYYGVVKRPMIRAAERRARGRQGQLAALATDSLRNVRLVQAFSRQHEEAARYRQQLNETTEANIDALDVSARYTPIATIVLAVGTGLVSWVGVVRVLDGRLSVGTLVVFLSYLTGIYGPIRSLSRLVSTFARGAASRERLIELFGDDDAVSDGSAVLAPGDDPGRLELVDVSFRYAPEIPVLEHIDLTIEPEQTVCIVGVSGAGKSTLLALLLRLYEPTSGSIRLGGFDVRDVALDSLRKHVSLVPQETWVMNGTIGENVLFGHPTATRAEFRYAVRRALLDEFVLDLPLGYDTPVGEGGVLLSGGQLRRVALARAMIRDSAILLLDEPTTGLDAASTAEVLSALASVSAGRTMVIVSHDLRLASRADRIVVISGGVVTEEGTHDALLANDTGQYSAMWKVQQASRTALEGMPLTSISHSHLRRQERR